MRAECWREPFIYCADFVQLQSGDGSVFTDLQLRLANECFFEAASSIYKALDNRIKVSLTQTSNGRDILPESDVRMVSSTQHNGISPNGFISYKFPVPALLEPGSELTLSASDFSGSPNNLRFALHGYNVFNSSSPYECRKNRKPFQYSLSSGSLGAYQSVTKIIVMDGSAGFLVDKITGSATSDCTVMINDVRPWSSRDVHFYNIAGDGQFGNLLSPVDVHGKISDEKSRWIPEGKILSVKFTDISGSTNKAIMTFHGRKVFLC